MFEIYQIQTRKANVAFGVKPFKIVCQWHCKSSKKDISRAYNM